MCQESSDRVHNKASLSKTREASKYQTFACALQSGCSKKFEKAQVTVTLLQYYMTLFK